ncbi:hypothetical protein SUDANB60_00258 [Streptomyces sp. enrichment culture]|uniref:hypothetical protein n=1 Tax=Streptomyces sp. enrichment culture TaxID=1795815 RepID=UPI003F57AC5C
MTRRSKQSDTANRLGVRAEAGEWCWIGEIPQPPANILQAAGNPRTRPARRPHWPWREPFWARRSSRSWGC